MIAFCYFPYNPEKEKITISQTDRFKKEEVIKEKSPSESLQKGDIHQESVKIKEKTTAKVSKGRFSKIFLDNNQTQIIYETDSLISFASSMLITIVAIFISLALIFYWQANSTLFNLLSILHEKPEMNENLRFFTNLMGFWSFTHAKVKGFPTKVYNCVSCITLIIIVLIIIIKLLFLGILIEDILNEFKWINLYYLLFSSFIVVVLGLLMTTIILLRKLTEIYSFSYLLGSDGVGLFSVMNKLIRQKEQDANRKKQQSKNKGA